MSEPSITIDTSSFKDAASVFGAMPEQVDMALKRAVARVTKWAANEIKRRAAKKLRVTGKVIKGRVVFYINDAKGRVFFGAWKVNAKHFRPKDNRPNGVDVGGRNFPHAFKIQKYGDLVFQRYGEKREITKGPNKGKIRQPLMVVRIPIKQEADDAVAEVDKMIDLRLLKEFESQLSFLKFGKQIHSLKSA